MVPSFLSSAIFYKVSSFFSDNLRNFISSPFLDGVQSFPLLPVFFPQSKQAFSPLTPPDRLILPSYVLFGCDFFSGF